MISVPPRCRAAGLALALLGVGALLHPEPASPLGRRVEPPPIVHGGRAFEKPYRSAFKPDRWKILKTGIPEDLTALWAIDARHAWAGGVSGGLYRTRDGGESWEPLVGVDLGRFVQLIWKGPDDGFALARDGEILRSANGGVTWETARKASSDRVLDMDFVDAEQGWAVGERGLILRTADGGGTWSRQGESLSDDLTVVQMLSEKTGWAGGSRLLLGTRNGGARWDRLEHRPSWRFVSGRRGYATDGEEIFGSSDGGESWRLIRGIEQLMRSEAEAPEEGAEAAPPRDQAGNPFIAEVDFVDRYNGVAEVVDGEMQRLFRTRSLGRVWKRVYQARRGEGRELVSFAMSDGRNGLAIDAEGSLRATGDGARSWKVQIESTYFDFRDVHFVDRDRGWAVGGQGRIAVTEDGGRSWREGARRADVVLRRVRGAALPSGEARAWAAGGEGTVLAANPEGRAWRSPWRAQRTPTRENILDLDVQAGGRGAAAGENGLLMTTEDGGDTWRRRSTGLKESIVAVALAGRRSVYAATAAALYESMDGGQSLRPLEPPPGRAAGAFVDLAAPGTGALFALQAEGRLLRWRGGRGGWNVIPVDPAARLRAMQMLDEGHGWVLGRKAGGGSALYLTEDGGRTWREIALPERDARAFHFVDRQEGWLLGPQSIQHSVDGGRNWRRQRIEASRFMRTFVLLDGGGAWAAGDGGFAARYPPPVSPSRPGAGKEGAGEPAPPSGS